MSREAPGILIISIIFGKFLRLLESTDLVKSLFLARDFDFLMRMHIKISCRQNICYSSTSVKSKVMTT